MHRLRQLAAKITATDASWPNPHTPWLSRLLLGAPLAYFASPIDLLPDVIPVLDLLIVAGLIYPAFRLIPPAVVASCRTQAAGIDSPL